jgi:hypothetical protein
MSAPYRTAHSTRRVWGCGLFYASALLLLVFLNVKFIALLNTNNIPCGVTELFLCDSQFATVFIQFNIDYYGTVRFSAMKKLALNKQKTQHTALRGGPAVDL